jgi:hypothetical protein
MPEPRSIGADLNRAVELACRALSHWRDGEMSDCRRDTLEAFEALRRACEAMGEK